MSIIRRSRAGRAFTLQEHCEVSDWNCQGGEGWPRIELALNYPDTSEMLGVVESHEIGPTLFLWAADWGIIVEPFSGGSFIYPSLAAALRALSQWAERIVIGERVPFGTEDGKPWNSELAS